jgi:DNA-directed RNA polymerase subunit RPC12/RpoP
VATEITFIVEYRCPRCGAALEARSSEAYGWLRCPQCGRASLPPEHMRTPRPSVRLPLDEDVLIIGLDRPGASASASAIGRASSHPGSFRRILGASALFLSLLIALLALLEHDQPVAVVFSLVAMVCLAISVYPARPRVA